MDIHLGMSENIILHNFISSNKRDVIFLYKNVEISIVSQCPYFSMPEVISYIHELQILYNNSLNNRLSAVNTSNQCQMSLATFINIIVHVS